MIVIIFLGLLAAIGYVFAAFICDQHRSAFYEFRVIAKLALAIILALMLKKLQIVTQK